MKTLSSVLLDYVSDTINLMESIPVKKAPKGRKKEWVAHIKYGKEVISDFKKLENYLNSFGEEE